MCEILVIYIVCIWGPGPLVLSSRATRQAHFKHTSSTPQAFSPPRRTSWALLGASRGPSGGPGELFLYYLRISVVFTRFLQKLKLKNHQFYTLQTSIFAIPYNEFDGFSIFQQVTSKTLSRSLWSSKNLLKTPQNIPKASPRHP